MVNFSSLFFFPIKNTPDEASYNDFLLAKKLKGLSITANTKLITLAINLLLVIDQIRYFNDNEKTFLPLNPQYVKV